MTTIEAIKINPLLTGEELIEFMREHCDAEAAKKFPIRPEEPSAADLALKSVLLPDGRAVPYIRVQSIGGRGISWWGRNGSVRGPGVDDVTAKFLWSNVAQGHFTIMNPAHTSKMQYLIEPLGREPRGNVLIDINHRSQIA